MIKLKPHNLKAVNEIEQAYASAASIIYTSGVGTGKSFVFMGVAERLQAKKILYIMPKHVIRNNIISYDDFSQLDAEVDFQTYNFFSSCDRAEKMFAKYDLVVIDECHHLGSDKYGKCLVSAMQSHQGNTKFLGLTATPVRDDAVGDVSGFFDAGINGLSNFDAISQGLMPEIEYRVCLPEKDLKQLEKEYDGSVRAQLSFNDSKEVLKKAAAAFPRNKWICFFPNVESLQCHEKLVKAMFPGYTILTLYSELGNLDEIVDHLKREDKAVVLSCNILLEGVHLPGIDGIVLFRNVTSLVCFQQMIGRICSIGKEVRPVVLDGSSSALKLMAKLISEGKSAGDQPDFTSENSKEIVRVGIGDYREYDLNRLLRLVDPSIDREENADKAISRYKGFHGSTAYRTIQELKANALDYKKLSACCRLYGVTLDFTMRRMLA